MTDQHIRNGADLLVETLLANDVDTCFANPGTSEMHFVAALDRKPQMRCVLGLAEGVVTAAADGYARMADKPAATLLHLGPGLANGISNLHNAKRARSPVLNVVGDHPDAHLPYDALLTSDIEGLARPVSHWVRRTTGPDAVGTDAAAGIAAARAHEGQIATLVLPADAAWSPSTAQSVLTTPVPEAPLDGAAIDAAAAMLRNGRRSLILASGRALRADALRMLDRIAQATGAGLMSQMANARLARGAGIPIIDKVPYPVDEAVEALAGVEQIVLVGARPAVGFFAVPGKPSLHYPPGCAILDLTPAGQNPADAVAALLEATSPGAHIKPRAPARADATLPDGPLTPDTLSQVVEALSPEGAVIVDESITSGRNLFPLTRGIAPCEHLQLTGGSIGIGVPLATGAAIGAPGHRILALQADGSAMYTVQGLWTQARERLDVTTVILSNRSYKILYGELAAVGGGQAGRNARTMLDLDDPALDWVSLARGMGVDGAVTDDTAEFADLLEQALRTPGPFLIEARI